MDVSGVLRMGRIWGGVGRRVDTMSCSSSSYTRSRLRLRGFMAQIAARLTLSPPAALRPGWELVVYYLLNTLRIFHLHAYIFSLRSWSCSCSCSLLQNMLQKPEAFRSHRGIWDANRGFKSTPSHLFSSPINGSRSLCSSSPRPASQNYKS